MNLEHASRKQLNDIEILVRELQIVMRKAKLQNEPLAEALKLAERELSQARRERFDAENPEFQGY
jgi:hypothetical protein